jgi:iron(III) transport system permease protein
MDTNHRTSLIVPTEPSTTALSPPKSLLHRIVRNLPLGPVALLTLLLILVAYPVSLIVITSLKVTDMRGEVTWGLDNYIELSRHLNWVGNTLLIAIPGTLLAIIMAVALAWIINRTEIPGRSWFETLIPLPYYMTPLIGALSWTALGESESGLINRAFEAITGSTTPLINITSVMGIIWVTAIFQMPAAYLMIAAAMRGMDPTLEEGSAVLGGGKFTTAWRVTLPLLKPAILGAALFLFTLTMGEFAIPAILGTHSRFYVVTTAIYVLFQGYPPNYSLAAALGVVLIFFTCLSLWFYNVILGKKTYSVISGRMYRPRLIKMGKWTPVLFAICLLYVLVGVILPLGVLCYASIQPGDVISFDPAKWTLKHYQYILFEYEPTRQALGNSLMLGMLTGTIGVVLAGLVSWVVTRSNVAGRRLLEYLAMFPQGVPGLVFAVGLLWAWAILPGKMTGTVWILLIAYLTVFLPLGVRGINGVMVQLDRSLEEASRVLGGSWLRTTWKITLPLLAPGIAATWMLLFISSIREVSSSMLLSSPKSRVLGPSMYNFWESGGMAQVSALAVVQTVVILAALMITKRFIERKLGGVNKED